MHDVMANNEDSFQPEFSVRGVQGSVFTQLSHRFEIPLQPLRRLSCSEGNFSYILTTRMLVCERIGLLFSDTSCTFIYH